MVIHKIKQVTRLVVPLILVPYIVHAQVPAFPAPASSTSPTVKADVARAKKIAGKDWAEAAHFWCEAPRANRATDPQIEPTKIFDNVYALGQTSTIMLAVQTSDGIVLFDSGYPDKAEEVLIPQMKKLGLDPTKIKALILTHGHPDHFGGAVYLQGHYGVPVYMALADWDFMEHPPAGRGGQKKGPDPVMPKRDRIIADGQPIVVGDEKIVPVFTPGHTPGSTSFIFQVRDNGKPHEAALFGGAVLLAAIVSDEGMQQFLHSIDRMKQEARKAKVDVEFISHPLMDGFNDKLALIRTRKPGSPNPFVIGQSSYQKLQDVMAACAQADVDRRKQP